MEEPPIGFDADITLRNPPYIFENPKLLKDVGQLKSDPHGWLSATQAANNQPCSIRVYDVDRYPWVIEAAKTWTKVGKQYPCGHILTYDSFVRVGDVSVLTCDRHHGSFVDNLHKKRIKPQHANQYLASMVDILAGCKRNSLHPQLNGFNLVLTNAGGVDDFGDLMNPAVKLAGLEHCTYTSGRNACYVQDVMVSDIPAGIRANFVACSPNEAACYLEPTRSGGYMLSEGDVVFRAGIILYAIYTGNHPGGSTGAQQLQWIMKARTVGKPSLPSTLRYGWCKLLEHMMHGDDTKRFQLEDVLGTMLLWEHNPAEFGFFMAETVDAIKDAKDEKTPEWQMRRRLDCGGGSSSSSRDNNISQLAFSGVDLKTRLPRPLLNLLLFFNPDDGLDEMAYAARLDDCEYDLTNPWSFLKSMRNKFDAHRDPARAAAIAAAGYTNGAMVYKEIMDACPDMLAVIAELAVELRVQRLVEHLRKLPFDPEFQGHQPRANTNPEREKLPVHKAVGELQLAPDARGAPPEFAALLAGTTGAGAGTGEGLTAGAAGGAGAERPWSGRGETPEPGEAGAVAGVASDAAAAAGGGGQQPHEQEVPGSLQHSRSASPISSGQQFSPQDAQLPPSSSLGGTLLSVSLHSTANPHMKQQTTAAVEDDGLLPYDEELDPGSSDQDGPPPPQAQQPPAQPRVLTDYSYWLIAQLPGAKYYNLVPLMLAPPIFRPSLVPLLLRPPRMVGFGCWLLSKLQQQGNVCDVVVMRLLNSLLHDVVFGRMYGPGVISLCVQAIRHALVCKPEVPQLTSSNTASLACNIIYKLYAAGNKLPINLDPSLAEQLQLLLPLVKLNSLAADESKRTNAASAACKFVKTQFEEQGSAVTPEQLQLQEVFESLLPPQAGERSWLRVLSAYDAASPRLQLWLRRPLEAVFGSVEALQAGALLQLATSMTGQLLLDQVAERILMYGDDYVPGKFLPRFSTEDKPQALRATELLLDRFCPSRYSRLEGKLECGNLRKKRCT